MNYTEFFSTATGGAVPFPYQERLATASDFPHLLDVPTGAGKTAAAALSWLWRRRCADEPVRSATPRRLVYCLPMRVLVEQTADECRKWINNLCLDGGGDDAVSIHLLMGGERDNDWDLYPERDAILIGTQDMLLSRALNRGYGASRYRWPAQYGLLHSDCLWVFDETQLFGVGLKTSAQLEAFRHIYGAAAPTHSLWMSATLTEDALGTIDAREQMPAPLSRIELGNDDLGDPKLRQRLDAPKCLHRCEIALTEDTKKGYAAALAEWLWTKHQSRSGQTLVVLNTVGRAQDVHARLQKMITGDVETLLVHSRFRQYERKQMAQRLRDATPPGGRIIIATQAIEAGVDISSKTLITELAPWSSLAQRFGRCNRYGEWGEADPAETHWIDLVLPDKDALPYAPEQLNKAREMLEALPHAGLTALKGKSDGLPEPVMPVIRRKDMLELFDTTPDLAGADIDISRFIRDGDNLDVQLYWREFDQKPEQDTPQPAREELCAVRVGAFRDFYENRSRDKLPFWVWDAFDGKWAKLSKDAIRPGLTVMVSTKAGGYNESMGWNPASKNPASPVPPPDTLPEEANVDDPYTHIGRFITLAEHSDHVVDELNALLNELNMSGEMIESLRNAARRHDWGKAHKVFQALLTARNDDEEPAPTGGPWAKSDRMRRLKNPPRPQFRHELAGALAALQTGQSDLVCYLIAAHHGKVRLSIRSMPEEKAPPTPGTRFARGIWDGDKLPPCDLGGEGCRQPEIVLDLTPMELGRGDDGIPSWLERTLGLREHYGPFTLAYLETLVRAADCRASKKEQES